jgi:hypothetical protein
MTKLVKMSQELCSSQSEPSKASNLLKLQVPVLLVTLEMVAFNSRLLPMTSLIPTPILLLVSILEPSELL